MFRPYPLVLVSSLSCVSWSCSGPHDRRRWIVDRQEVRGQAVLISTFERIVWSEEQATDGRRPSARIRREVPSFLAALLALVKSNLLMNAPVPIGHEAFAAMGLRSARPPFALPTARLSLGWHERFHRDPAHRWVRDLAFSTFRSRFDQANERDS